jgi:hypothetical protein
MLISFIHHTTRTLIAPAWAMLSHAFIYVDGDGDGNGR